MEIARALPPAGAYRAMLCPTRHEFLHAFGHERPPNGAIPGEIISLCRDSSGFQAKRCLLRPQRLKIASSAQRRRTSWSRRLNLGAPAWTSLDLLRAALLGILQGLTEFLPVSSTGHLLIVGRAIGYDDPGGVFTVMIQLGSILAIMWLYRQRIWDVITGLPTKPEARRFALMLFFAFLPAAFIGLHRQLVHPQRALHPARHHRDGRSSSAASRCWRSRNGRRKSK